MVGGGGMSKVDWSKAPEGAEFFALGRFRRQGTGANNPQIFDHVWRTGGFPHGECLIADDYEPRPVSDPLNGYLWSVEYRVNGVKPNIPGDVLRRYTCVDGDDGECQFKSLCWGEGCNTIKTIRIIDSRYAPAPPAPQWPDDEERIDRIGRDRTSDDTGHYAPTHPVTAVEFLNACVTVQSERGQQYDPNGTGERSFAAAAIAFTALTGKPLVGSDICLIIELVKKVRQYSKPDRIHHDSLLDSVSYDSLWAAELIKELSK
jgi:hypothetical protein